MNRIRGVGNRLEHCRKIETGSSLHHRICFNAQLLVGGGLKCV